jgi:hypothetical protein
MPRQRRAVMGACVVRVRGKASFDGDLKVDLSSVVRDITTVTHDSGTRQSLKGERGRRAPERP